MPHGLTVLRELLSCQRQAASPGEFLERAVSRLSKHFPAVEFFLYLRPPEELYYQRVVLFPGCTARPHTLPKSLSSVETEASEVVDEEGGRRKIVAIKTSSGNAVLCVEADEPVPDGDHEQFWPLVAELLGEAAAALKGPHRLSDHQVMLLSRTIRGLLHHPQLNRQMTLLLAVLTAQETGMFEQALLFMVNRRAGMLQGMFGLKRLDSAQLLGPPSVDPERDWPTIPSARQQLLLSQPLASLVRQMRFELDGEDNPLSRAALSGQVEIVPALAEDSTGGERLYRTFGMDSCHCVPLKSGESVIAVVLLIPQADSRADFPQGQHFITSLTAQAGKAFALASMLEHQEQSLREARELQERQLQQERFEAVGEVSASVAHELRNPLVTVGGFARRLSWSLPGGTREKDYADIIAREVRRVEEMLDNILAFSRGNLVCLAPCRFDDIAQAVIELFSVPFREREVELQLEVGEGLPELNADAQQLRQVLENLLRNSAEALLEGGEVTVSLAGCVVRESEGIELSVEDTGGGIPPEVLRNIFNPFYTTRSEGTGLGLAIVRRIVEQHHGEIDVCNTEQGARFRVRIPLESPEGDAIEKPQGFG